MAKCREAFETWFRTTKAYQMLEEQNYFKMDIFHFVDGRNEYRHTSVQIAFMTWLSRQAELDQLVQEYSPYRNKNFSYEATAKHFETVANEKDKRIESALYALKGLKAENDLWGCDQVEAQIDVLEKALRGGHG